MIRGKEYDQHRILELGPPEKRKGMKNDERDENSPVEILDVRLKRLRTNRIDGRYRQLGRETDEYLEEIRSDNTKLLRYLLNSEIIKWREAN